MSFRQQRSHNSSISKSFPLTLQTAPAWIAILGFFFVVVLCLLIGAESILIPIFPLGSLVVGIFLYCRHPSLYVGFTWWMWFIGPFVRRLIDYRLGYITHWPYMLAPLLVTSISFVTLVQYLPRTYKRDGLPFMLCFVCITYGFIVGLIGRSISDFQMSIVDDNPERQIISLLGWLSPILFGFHLFVNWRNYPNYRQKIQSSFFWGVLFMGVYGICQFLLAPAWDKFFLLYQDFDWMGTPEPLGIRVWSTMTGPVPFAINLMPGLLLLLINKEKWRFVVAGVGYIAFLLSGARSAWYSWLVAFLLFFASMKQSYQLRLIVLITGIIIITILLVIMGPFSDVIVPRIESFSNIESDDSYQSRIEQFQVSLNYALSEFIGWGLDKVPSISTANQWSGGFSSDDNGYLVILVSLGWFASILYLGGIAMLFFILFRHSNNRVDIFAINARSIAFASLVRILTSNVTSSEYAMPIWGFLGIAMAAQKYYESQSRAEQRENRYLYYD